MYKKKQIYINMTGTSINDDVLFETVQCTVHTNIIVIKTKDNIYYILYTHIAKKYRYISLVNLIDRSISDNFHNIQQFIATDN